MKNLKYKDPVKRALTIIEGMDPFQLDDFTLRFNNKPLGGNVTISSLVHMQAFLSVLLVQALSKLEGVTVKVRSTSDGTDDMPVLIQIEKGGHHLQMLAPPSMLSGCEFSELDTAEVKNEALPTGWDIQSIIKYFTDGHLPIREGSDNLLPDAPGNKLDDDSQPGEGHK